ncbi:MAG: iron-sulfur cluster assembly scaffold protein [Ureaplasma sp.]|nr:iron-sulfur cluster assembly scaffold protein [Ureaplasma sp.]MDE7221959.1 iron-sulfur cluster assembly scaffold protein [Ureaplasma sp.]
MSYSKDPMFLRSIIMQHYDQPNNKIEHKPDQPYISYQNKSATCIDDITVHIKMENNKISDVLFSGIGCAISTSSTDIVSSLIKNKTISESLIIIENYLKMIDGQEYDEELLDELIAFYKINEQPNRLRCAKIGVLAIYNCLKEMNNNGN